MIQTMKRTNSIPLSHDVLIYAVGTLKNVSHDAQNVAVLAAEENTISVLIDLLSLHVCGQYNVLTILVKHTMDKEHIEKNAQLLVQVTATLRNIASAGKQYKKMLKCGLVAKLVPVLQENSHFVELVLNCTRLLRYERFNTNSSAKFQIINHARHNCLHMHLFF